MLQGDGYYYWMYNQGDWARDMVVRSRSLDRDFGSLPIGMKDGVNRLAPSHGSNESQAGPEIIFDPNREVLTSLYAYSWSPCGRYFSAILQEAG